MIDKGQAVSLYFSGKIAVNEFNTYSTYGLLSGTKSVICKISLKTSATDGFFGVLSVLINADCFMSFSAVSALAS